VLQAGSVAAITRALQGFALMAFVQASIAATVTDAHFANVFETRHVSSDFGPSTFGMPPSAGHFPQD